MPKPSPANIRAIFGQNLQRLCAQGPSVSAICRKIGINRTQFNRYLTGDSFPRPDVLERICLHFNVDARILLRPLD
ncbi:MAG: XRE family transcriptional regulator, partial [Rhodobacteraceae bacterium]|jgi:transcriptional regulator with XRE-family HTH domain|nr:XRE family transcriptional regulator [Paracoccaceae bacterium]